MRVELLAAVASIVVERAQADACELRAHGLGRQARKVRIAMAHGFEMRIQVPGLFALITSAPWRRHAVPEPRDDSRQNALDSPQIVLPT